MQIPFHSTRLRRRPARTAEPTPLGVLGSLRVGQKLALLTLAFGLPIAALLAATLAGQQRDLAGLRSEWRGLQGVAPLAGLHAGLFSYTSGVLGQGSAVSAEGARIVDRSLQQLRSEHEGLAPRLTLIARDWAALRTANAAGPTATYLAYEGLLLRHGQPLADDLLATSGLNLEPDAAASALLAANLRDLGQVAGRLSLLEVLTRSAQAGDPVAGWAGRARNQLPLLEHALKSYRDDLDRATARRPELRGLLGPETTGLLSAAQEAVTATTGMLAAVSPRPEPRVLTSYAALRTRLERASVATNQQISAALQARQSGLGRGAALGLLALAAVLAAAIALLAAIWRSIAQPLGHLTTAGRELAAGNLRTSVPITTRDELGELAWVLNNAVAQLRTEQERNEFQQFQAEERDQHVAALQAVTRDIAGGDLTRRGTVSEDGLGDVVDSINRMAEELGSVLRSVQGTTQDVADGSRALRQAAAGIEDSTHATTRETAQLGQRAQAISHSLRQTAALARASAEASRRALLASQQGQQALSDTLDGLQTIRHSSQDARSRVQALSQRSDEIRQVVETVSQLASQVNLLSLHASIEAAGAGAAGSRFAAVAEEVRLLADESTAATARIASLVSELRAEIRQVALGLGENATQVERGHAVADSAGGHLRELGELAGITAQLAHTISSASEGQVQGVGQVAQGVLDIAATVGSSQQAAAQTRDAADRLEELAQELGARLTRFRLS